MPVGPISPVPLGPEFRIQPLEESRGADKAGDGFADLIADQLGRLEAVQQDAASQSQALAAGTAEDVTSVVMAVERASLALQLATQVRNKAVEAYHDVFRMQI